LNENKSRGIRFLLENLTGNKNLSQVLLRLTKLHLRIWIYWRPGRTTFIGSRSLESR